MSLLRSWLEEDMSYVSWEIVGNAIEFKDDGTTASQCDINHYDTMWAVTYPDNVVLLPIHKNEEMLATWFNLTCDKTYILNEFMITENLRTVIQDSKDKSVHIMCKNTGASSISKIEIVDFHYVSNCSVLSTPMNIISTSIAITFEDYDEQVEFVLTWGDARHDTND